jgi:hypothetical protein
MLSLFICICAVFVCLCICLRNQCVKVSARLIGTSSYKLGHKASSTRRKANKLSVLYHRVIQIVRYLMRLSANTARDLSV